MRIRIRRVLLAAIAGAVLVAPTLPAAPTGPSGVDSRVPAPANLSSDPDPKATTNPVCGTCV
jgi:hypothetical protein